jgi:hypothetical protein
MKIPWRGRRRAEPMTNDILVLDIVKALVAGMLGISIL